MQRGSGKSSLINAVFKVDTSVGVSSHLVDLSLTVNSGNQAATGNIHQEVYRDDNRYLIFHECSAFGPGEGQNLQAIRDFILTRTDQACPPTERLHAVW